MKLHIPYVVRRGRRLYWQPRGRAAKVTRPEPLGREDDPEAWLRAKSLYQSVIDDQAAVYGDSRPNIAQWPGGSYACTYVVALQSATHKGREKKSEQMNSPRNSRPSSRNSCRLMKHLPDSVPPRGLNRWQAAEYVGISTSLFESMVNAGELPRGIKIRGRMIWDRAALDQCFDRWSGLGSHYAAAAEKQALEAIECMSK